MKKHCKTMAAAFSVVLLAGLAAFAQMRSANDFQKARELEEMGKADEAFQAYPAIPGAEHAAITLARSKAKEYLAVLASPPPNADATVVNVVEADLLLALERKDEALACLRIAVRDIQADYYPVEPPVQSNYRQLLNPYSFGPGSHRDNRLIRRFIALDAWEDAAREFARIWEIHRRRAQPYIVSASGMNAPTVERQDYLITPAGYDSRSLQFAIDYAYFLKRRNHSDAALDVLLEMLLCMDMDRDPNMNSVKPISNEDAKPYPRGDTYTSAYYREISAGISRKEFIRLAYMEFKTAGKENDLVEKLQAHIKEENASRRVLARIFFHQNKKIEAMALELDYIEKSNFPERTATYRRGCIYEEMQKYDRAIEEYEKLSSLPITPVVGLPDPGEEIFRVVGLPNPRDEMIQGSPAFTMGPAGDFIRRDAVDRLTRLYASQGKTDKVLENVLRPLDLDSNALVDVNTLEKAAMHFRAAGKEEAFKQWLKVNAAGTEIPAAKAAMHWMLGDYDKAASALAESVRSQKMSPSTLEFWKYRFEQKGRDTHRMLLKSLLAVNPKDASTRLELLDLENQFEGRDAIEMLELLLDSDGDFAFGRGKGARNRTRFRNYFDLAYRLMRLYEKTPGNEAKLRALGFRILEGDKPFQCEPGVLAKYRANWNNSLTRQESQSFDILNCSYVLLAHLKNPADIERAATGIEKTGSVPLINQINRLRAGERRPRVTPITGYDIKQESVDVRTLGVPDGVRVLTNRDDVRAIAPGARWGGEGDKPGRVWIGTSWGLVRYTERGSSGGALEILQIPLETGVLIFADTPSGLYFGTRDGLFRLDDPDGENPSPVRIGVEAADEKKRDRVEGTVERDGAVRTEHIHEAFPVHQLVWWKNQLWIQSNGEIYRLDPKRKSSRHFGRYGALYVGAGRLWASQAVYDPQKEDFRAHR
jgi:tetratricopeptide (TPR) repeat protein